MVTWTGPWRVAVKGEALRTVEGLVTEQQLQVSACGENETLTLCIFRRDGGFKRGDRAHPGKRRAAYGERDRHWKIESRNVQAVG